MGWYAKEFRASYDKHSIKLDSIDMVNVSQWPSGEWKAAGWWKVWHSGEKKSTVEDALRSLIETVALYVIEDNKQKERPR